LSAALQDLFLKGLFYPHFSTQVSTDPISIGPKCLALSFFEASGLKEATKKLKEFRKAHWQQAEAKAFRRGGKKKTKKKAVTRLCLHLSPLPLLSAPPPPPLSLSVRPKAIAPANPRISFLPSKIYYFTHQKVFNRQNRFKCLLLLHSFNLLRVLITTANTTCYQPCDFKTVCRYPR